MEIDTFSFLIGVVTGTFLVFLVFFISIIVEVLSKWIQKKRSNPYQT